MSSAADSQFPVHCIHFLHHKFLFPETEMDFALVPSAYERVTDFFWDMKLENCMNFIFPTPQYGLVCKNDYHIDNNENITIATCHAEIGRAHV